ncbi:hypothetical protein [Aneurinibacillus migulanus]|nr:hypothetical protein [Aneurinibacillus migulanus]MED0896435.1 hypothetical protein [Aneurinibacillus migulanus]MED1616094.1 hypothetical protein [Aneurinibacillus migulanus]MED4729716.1 hypothetical protein [Aneurinibacillus migulanus]GED14966.1 hypothetical protein AMI01nite_29570 [Aneurinibacillus migulanus]
MSVTNPCLTDTALYAIQIAQEQGYTDKHIDRRKKVNPYGKSM